MSTTPVSTTTVCMTTTTISTIVFQGLNLPVRPQTTCSFTLLNMLHENQATKKVIFSNSALIHTHTRAQFLSTLFLILSFFLSLSHTHIHFKLLRRSKKSLESIWISRRTKNLWIEQNLCKKLILSHVSFFNCLPWDSSVFILTNWFCGKM